ncbi:MAG: hypothetical protein WCC36_02935 [Gammaproteobacteria bacterium]
MTRAVCAANACKAAVRATRDRPRIPVPIGTAVAILDNLAGSLGGSPYFNINTTYYDCNNNKVSNAVAAPASTVDNYSRGTALGDADVKNIVADSISSGALSERLFRTNDQQSQ